MHAGSVGDDANKNIGVCNPVQPVHPQQRAGILEELGQFPPRNPSFSGEISFEGLMSSSYS